MSKVINLLFLSCSIIAVSNVYAVPSSEEDDGKSLKRSIAKENQSAKRIRNSESEDAPLAVKVAQMLSEFDSRKLDPFYSLSLQIWRAGADLKIDRLSVEEQKELALVNKHYHGLVLQYRMQNDPRQLHLNPWVLLPGWEETKLYRLNAAVFHGAYAMMSAQVVNEGEDSFLKEHEGADYAKPIRAARKFISRTFGVKGVVSGVLGSIVRYFEDAEGQLIADAMFNPDLPFPQEIADFSTLNAKSRTIDHKSEYDLMCLHLYLTAEPTAGEEFDAQLAEWLTIDPETNPYRMSLPQRNAYVYDLMEKMEDRAQYTLEERGEFARKVCDFFITLDMSNVEMRNIIDALVETEQYILAADVNLRAGNYQKVVEIYEFERANGRAHSFDLGDYNRLITAYQHLGQQDKVFETRQLAAQHNINLD